MTDSLINCFMRNNKLFLLLTLVFMMACFPVSAQQTVGAGKDSADMQAKLDSTIERINELSKMSSEQLDSLLKKMQEDLRKPIASTPKAGGRINGHVLDMDGNPIRYRSVNICERDIVGRAVTKDCTAEDGFFMLMGIKKPENYLTFGAEGYETQTLPIDRGTYEIRLKPVPVALKPGDVIKGPVTCWQKDGNFRAGYASTGAVVAELDDNGNTVSSTVIEDRTFSLRITRPGNTLVVSKDGYTTFMAPIEITNYVIGLDKIEYFTR